jgi:hypothetical protein
MHEGCELLTALIDGTNSFAKRAKRSRRFQEIWVRKQVEELAKRRSGNSGSQQDGFVALQNLAYTESRFDSRSEPMSILCSRFAAMGGIAGHVA